MTDDPMDAVLVQLARRKADRGIRALDATFASYGFNPYDGSHGTEIARLARAIGPGTDDFGADLTGIAVSAMEHFGHPCDPAEVHAAVTRHLEGRP